jgi:hypothetical protein
MADRLTVEVTRDVLGWVLRYARDFDGYREGDPMCDPLSGDPDYYKTKAEAEFVAKAINGRGSPRTKQK